MERKISISIDRLQLSYGDERALEIAREVGADGVDFGTYGSRWDYKREDSPFALSDEALFEHMTTLRRKAEALGLEVFQTHGRLKGFCGRADEDADVLENARRDCIATAALGAPICVMHGVATGRVGADAAPEFMHDLNFKMFNSILPFAKQYNIRIATETFGDALDGSVCDFFGSCHEFIPAFDRIAAAENGQYLTACMDTGHTNKAMRFGFPPPPMPSAISVRRLLACTSTTTTA